MVIPYEYYVPAESRMVPGGGAGESLAPEQHQPTLDHHSVRHHKLVSETIPNEARHFVDAGLHLHKRLLQSSVLPTGTKYAPNELGSIRKLRTWSK
jgi:hypothetical protein